MREPSTQEHTNVPALRRKDKRFSLFIPILISWPSHSCCECLCVFLCYDFSCTWSITHEYRSNRFQLSNADFFLVRKLTDVPSVRNRNRRHHHNTSVSVPLLLLVFNFFSPIDKYRSGSAMRSVYTRKVERGRCSAIVLLCLCIAIHSLLMQRYLVLWKKGLRLTMHIAASHVHQNHSAFSECFRVYA